MTEADLGKIDTLFGLCESCGTEPRRKRFARSFAAGAFAGVLIVEFLLLIFLLGGVHSALIPPLIVAAICVAVYVFAMQSESVTYANQEHRIEESRSQRILGWLSGFAVGIGVLIGYVFLANFGLRQCDA